MKRIHYIYLTFLITISLIFCVETEQKNVNEKFKFVQEIYTESWALIIGINDYQNVEPLSYAVSDAEAVKEMFVEKYGFKEGNITLITDEDATKDNILDGFSDILEKAKEKDRVVVFYAGHGETYKLPSGGDMGYLIPVDGTLDNLYRSSIPMKSVYDIAEMSYAKHILYLVDACYGGLTLNTRGLKKDTTPEYLKKMTRERGRQVITAGGKDEQVIEKPEWGHSAFTRNLLKGLGDDLADENSDGIITADELGGFIRNRVPIDSDGAHTPQRGRIGSDMGEFVFISETLDDELAEAFPQDKQMNAMEEKMAALEQMMLAQQSPSVPAKSKVKKVMNVKIATKKALTFPGRGHFYSNQKGKGFMFTGLELASLAGLAVFGSSYSTKVDEFDTAQSDYDNIDLSSGDYTLADVNRITQVRTDAYSAKNKAFSSMIGCGTSAAIIWLWNVYDIKKNFANKTSDVSPISVGLNPTGQVQLKISF
jgi:hypothetical protein